MNEKICESELSIKLIFRVFFQRNNHIWLICNLGTTHQLLINRLIVTIAFHQLGIAPELSSSFGVHRFAGVACDYTIEQPLKRDCKTKGGLTGFSMNRACVYTCVYLSPSGRAATTGKCKEISGIQKGLR